MKPITMFEANDGSRWSTTAEALKRDALIDECRAVEVELGMVPAPETTEFGNGGGYIQHPEGTRDRLIERLRKMGANRDSDGPVGKLLARAWRMDDIDREWGQGYYAANPHEGKQRQLNPPASR